MLFFIISPIIHYQLKIKLGLNLTQYDIYLFKKYSKNFFKIFLLIYIIFI